MDIRGGSEGATGGTRVAGNRRKRKRWRRRRRRRRSSSSSSTTRSTRRGGGDEREAWVEEGGRPGGEVGQGGAGESNAPKGGQSGEAR